MGDFPQTFQVQHLATAVAPADQPPVGELAHGLVRVDQGKSERVGDELLGDGQADRAVAAVAARADAARLRADGISVPDA